MHITLFVIITCSTLAKRRPHYNTICDTLNQTPHGTQLYGWKCWYW